MSTKTQTKKKIEETFDAAREAALKEVDKVVEKEDDGKLLMKNRKGEMLLCNLTIQKRPGAPDPLCVTVNEEIKWVKRGAKVIVPWYFVVHLLNNIETRFHQEKDESGKKFVVPETGPSEPISYSAIDPADDNPPLLT